MNKRLVFISSAVILLLLFVGGAIVYSKHKAEEALEQATRNKAVLVRDYSPTLGRREAKVHIVEFFDPACDTCKEFYPFVKNLMAADSDKIRLTLRYAPFHNGSDQVVKILEASRKQGKFWQVLTALYEAQAYWSPNHQPQQQLVWGYLEGLGLNLEQMKIDMNSPEIAQRIEQDLSDAKTLNVTQTPEFFVNGRPMPSFGFDQLKGLVQDALAQEYR